MSFAIEGRIRRPFESMTRQKPYDTLFFQSCGKREQGQKQINKGQTQNLFLLRLQTGALPRIPTEKFAKLTQFSHFTSAEL